MTKPLGSKPSKSPRQWIRRLGLGYLSILLGLPLLYYGYCWGLWGRSSLLLQYLFQCTCPPASEEARYPKEVDVIVSACGYSSSRLSPSGRFLYVRENRLLHTSTYLLDLHTDEKTAIPSLEKDPYFLTDDLLYVSISYRTEEYILNRITKDKYPIQRFRALRPDAYTKGDANPEILAEALRGEKYVFLINDNDTVVVLATDFHINPGGNFITDRFDIPGFDPDRLEQFLKDNNIKYQTVIADFPGEVVSPDGRLIARRDGIYLVESNQKIVEGYSLSVRGWADDSHALIYSQHIVGPCLIRTNFGSLDDFACIFEVPQPVLLLKVPDEYLSP